ncbi:RING-type E3 ubiquitin transferase [Salvia divinorum]|uniref:RING-type E3 ubiquitin transferase n=1 Tax=Salvia divinorum TaxID=28513 RepID=A0ABD1IFW8_SALDI
MSITTQKAIGKPHAYLKFGSPNVEDIEEDAGYYFVSTVCWKVRSQQQGNDQSVGPRTTNDSCGQALTCTRWHYPFVMYNMYRCHLTVPGLILVLVMGLFPTLGCNK